MLCTGRHSNVGAHSFHKLHVKYILTLFTLGFLTYRPLSYLKGLTTCEKKMENYG